MWTSAVYVVQHRFHDEQKVSTGNAHVTLLESLLALLGIAALLLQVSKRLHIPYPVLLAFAGCIVGAFPDAPKVTIEPHVALAVFIAPALFDASYDSARRRLRRNWFPLLGLVVFAVLLTTAAVAWLGVAYAGLGWAAAITLGAIVAPPDAAAVSAMLRDSKLPRNVVVVLEGESLLNDAVALLIFGIASSLVGSTEQPASSVIWTSLLAAPAGAVFGWIMGRLFIYLAQFAAQTLSLTIIEFVMVFGVWTLAERLQFSPIITVVAFAMTVSKYMPARQSARDRVHSYSVWEATVFILNVLAFLLMGLQARAIFLRIPSDEFHQALTFAGFVLATVLLVRIAWIFIYTLIERQIFGTERAANGSRPSWKSKLIVSWCGIRGLVTIATSFALPGNFPHRDLILLAAFTVVIGTLLIQGLSLGPIVRWLDLKSSGGTGREISKTRVELAEVGLKSLEPYRGAVADAVRAEYELERDLAFKTHDIAMESDFKRLRIIAIEAQRKELHEWRTLSNIDDDTYHILEEELDWAELGATPQENLKIGSI